MVGLPGFVSQGSGLLLESWLPIVEASRYPQTPNLYIEFKFLNSICILAKYSSTKMLHFFFPKKLGRILNARIIATKSKAECGHRYTEVRVKDRI